MKRSVVGLLALVLAACSEGTEDGRDVSSTRVVQRPHAPLPPGTVPRGARAHADSLAPPEPPAATPALLAHGQERFAAFCTPCHGARGHGDGVVVSRGFPAPPSYHQKRLLDAPPEHFVSIITHGKGAMYSYAERIPPEDRWAIALYVKQLQADEARSSATAAPVPAP
ncbi:MAG TPA: cytochrome c [Mesorhizobium sp.]|jgi:mono/diheme cytochrome c family protein|nr:cytochrome c [Mesorhizobium sp.]